MNLLYSLTALLLLSAVSHTGGQTLHGGLIGVDMAVWNVLARTESSITFGYRVPDGQDGFPGNLDIELTYTLTEDNSLDISYKATTDKQTSKKQ